MMVEIYLELVIQGEQNAHAHIVETEPIGHTVVSILAGREPG